jgi:hypothetical protein
MEPISDSSCLFGPDAYNLRFLNVVDFFKFDGEIGKWQMHRKQMQLWVNPAGRRA